MSRAATFVILFICLSLGIAPLAHVHTHADETHENGMVTHGGHMHAAEAEYAEHHLDADREHETHVFDLQSEFLKPDLTGTKIPVWIAAILFVLLPVLVLGLLHSTRFPPRTRTRPPSPYPHRFPLLRGPPSLLA
jgi:hypothetical protein